MWVNALEIPGNGIDDDGNGYVDDIYGANMITNAGDPMDDNGHGTHVAGIIGATNNDQGIVGVAYNARIMAVKAGQGSGVFNQSDIAEGILYAWQNGADVINMSFGGPTSSTAVQDALTSAYTRCVLVAAAGNEGQPRKNYPASFTYVIGVMAVDSNSTEARFTNYDAQFEVYAPGVNMLSTFPGDKYVKLNGTSMATPVVSGFVALLRSNYADRDMYPSRYIMAQVTAASEKKAICIHDPIRHNMPPIIDTLSSFIKSPRPDVHLMSYAVLEPEDNFINAGDTVQIGLTLRNRWGKAADAEVTLDARSYLGIDDSGEPIFGPADPYVEILTGSVNLGEVGTYSTKTMLTYGTDQSITGIENPLVVKIADDCPNDYNIRLWVNLTYENALDENDTSIYGTSDHYTEAVMINVTNGVVKSGFITEDEVWTKDHLYIIPGALTIREGATVTVLPGAKIQFWADSVVDPYTTNSRASLTVNGAFHVCGTVDEPVHIYPSDGHYNYAVTITGNNETTLQYAVIYNPRINAFLIDHCRLSSLSENFVNPDSIYSKLDPQVWWSSYPGFTLSNTELSNLYQIQLGDGNGNGNSTIESCLFSNVSNTTYTASSGSFAVKGMTNISRTVFYADKGEYENRGLTVKRPNNQFSSNAILNDFHNTDTRKWVMICGEKNSSLAEFNISGNWWGTTNKTMIDHQIYDMVDDGTRLFLNPSPWLTEPPEDVWPFVTDAYVLDSTGQRVDTIGNETATFVVEFNRDMDTEYGLRIRFGPSYPYAEYEVPGAFVTPRRWEGVYTLKTTIESGTEFFNISDGRAADDHWLEIREAPGRHSFELDTTSAMAMNMQGNAVDSGIELTWNQDDFDTLAGYNLYRADSENGTPVKLNGTVIPVGEEIFVDTAVSSGQVYYYSYTVVLTDMTETIPSGKTVVQAPDVVAPVVTHTPLTTAYTGTNLMIRANITDDVSVGSAKVFYRTAGQSEWTSAELSASGSQWSGMIPADKLDPAGLEYYIEASDGFNTGRVGSAETPILVQIIASPCGQIGLTHDWGDWELTQGATCTETGSRKRSCLRCGETETEEIPSLGHLFGEWETVEPTCVNSGSTTRVCERCGATDAAEVLPALGHSYVNGFCTRCGEADPDYTLATIYLDPQYVRAGTTVTVPVSIYQNPGIAGMTLQITAGDGLTLTEIDKGGLLTEAEGAFEKNVAAGFVNWTCPAGLTGDGELLRLSFAVSAEAAHGSVQTVVISAKDDKPTNVSDVNGAAIPVNFVPGELTVTRVLFGDTNTDEDVTSLDAVRLVRALVALETLTTEQAWAADVDHNDDVTSADAVILTRYLAGYLDSLSAAVYPTRRGGGQSVIRVETVVGDPGESVTVPVVIENNPGFAGFTLAVDCPEGLELTAIRKGSLLNGSESGSFLSNPGKKLVNWNDSSNLGGDGQLFLLTFTISETGEPGTVYPVSVGLRDGKASNFVSESGQCIGAEFESGRIGIGWLFPCDGNAYCPGKDFADMPDKDNWAHDPIDWAILAGITVGTSDTTFSPDQRCTRAQIVTFLWRAAGSPVPTIEALSFTDVQQTAYYYDAVRWAVENGITNGVSETSFCPNKTCSRSEAVTFLWRASGSPVPTQTEMPFTDVPGDIWYTTPVLWAVENHITAGTSETTYSPHQSCTRAQIVTFLWRASRIPE